LNSANPEEVIDTSYGPGGKSEIKYVPAELVVVVRTVPVAVFLAVTAAPATTAPDGSVTVPLIIPVSVWQNMRGETTAIRVSSAANLARACIVRSLLREELGREWLGRLERAKLCKAELRVVLYVCLHASS